MSWTMTSDSPDGRVVYTFKGKKLTEAKEIIEFIDTYMKPYDLNLLPNPDEYWEGMRAMSIFQALFNREDRVEIYVESIANRENMALVIYRHVKERYPDLGWSQVT